MPGPEFIKGLERGLQVLQALQTNRIASLQKLHVLTGYSKPSLLRVLNTLERAGFVSRRLADGEYRISAFADIGRKRDRYGPVAEAAAPVLDRLCDKVQWPSDLMVPAGLWMERRESSQPHSPFAMSPDRKRIGQRVNWLLTAVGRAYLAYCPGSERDRILTRLSRSKRPEDRLAREPARFARILQQTRDRGYGTRDPTFLGGGYGNPPVDDGLAGIAVPLIEGERVHGVINIIWIRSAFPIEAFAARYLDDLRSAATEIVESLATQPNKPLRAKIV
jgi:IclR family mhp operon transcriptional activator